MKNQRIYSICPDCGNSTWYRKKDGDFECAACGDIVDACDMVLGCTDDKEVQTKTSKLSSVLDE